MPESPQKDDDDTKGPAPTTSGDGKTVVESPHGPASLRMSGQRIGDYQLLHELGHGGQGYVYLAKDLRLPRRVALKLLPASLSFSEAVRMRFLREAETASRMNHPGICTVYESGEHEGVPFIAMEYIEGKALNEWIEATQEQGDPNSRLSCVSFDAREEPAPEPRSSTQSTASLTTQGRQAIDRAVALVEKTARALHVAHEKGLIHRDIKPANIMVAPDARPVVLDFGLARQEGTEHGLTQVGELMGTPAYMSPEQLTRQTIQLDRRTDVYSLGVVLYECVTLHRPFHDIATREALYEAILMKDPPEASSLNPAVSRDLSIILTTAMDKDRDRRYQTALDFAEDLRRLRKYEPIKARPAGAWLRIRRWRKRNPVLAHSLASISAILIAVLLWTVHKNNQLAAAKTEAEENARAARTSADVAQRALTKLERLSDGKLLRDLGAREPALWPARAETLPHRTAWLVDARGLVGRLDEHRANLDEIRAEGEAIAEAGGGYRFPTRELEWHYEVLDELVERIQDFATPEVGLFDRIKKLDRFARDVEQETITRYSREWSRVIRGIAASDRYDGLEITPQPGLIPLGKDPDSGLHEFLHWQTHDENELPPIRNDGRLEFDAKTGIIFVLLPKGSVGAASVEPFLVSKYEMTQDQWLRVMAENPGPWKKGMVFEDDDDEITGLHPINGVRPEVAVELLRRLDLWLMTADEWTHACSAGSDGLWHTGDERDSLSGHANIADVAMRRIFRERRFEAGFDDGFARLAPVGSFDPNDFGLHDVHGNVREWCVGRGGDGRIWSRGGCFFELAERAMTDHAVATGGGAIGPLFGIRPAARLKPAP